MRLGWETTTADIAIVLHAHGIKCNLERLNQLCGLLDFDVIDDAVFSHCDFDDQVAAMLSSIETQLISKGVIQGTKYFDPDEDSSDIEDSDCWDEEFELGGEG